MDPSASDNTATPATDRQVVEKLMSLLRTLFAGGANERDG
jgi:hypothetical protein